MSRRFLPLLCAGVFALAGLAWAADEPPAKQPDEPPLRLKKKKQADEQPKAEPGKTEPGKGDPAKPTKPPEKKEPPKAEDKEPEAERPEIDEKEVLARITKNIRSVEEKLAKGEITDGTRQTQDDILKDLELLLDQSRRGSANNQDQQQQQNQDQQNQDQQNQQGKQGKAGSQSKGGAGKQSGSKGGQQQGMGKSSGRMSRSQARAMRRQQQRASRPGGKQGGSRQAKGQQPGQDQNMAKGGSGSQPGGGGTSSGPKYRNADLDKTSVWGHLPEAMRPDMNAYSSPQPFMPKYDDLIKKYYRTIAEQGRRKGD